MGLGCYLLAVEADGGDGVGVLAVLEPVKDGGLAAPVQPDHDAVVAAAGAQGDEALQRGAPLLAHARTHRDNNNSNSSNYSSITVCNVFISLCVSADLTCVRVQSQCTTELLHPPRRAAVTATLATVHCTLYSGVATVQARRFLSSGKFLCNMQDQSVELQHFKSPFPFETLAPGCHCYVFLLSTSIGGSPGPVA